MRLSDGDVGDQRKLVARRVERRALAVDKLEGEADERDERAKVASSSGTRRRRQLGIGQMAADERPEILPVRPRQREIRHARGTRPRHSVPLETFSCFEPENVPHLRIALIVIGIDDGVVCPEETCGNSVNNPLTEAEL